MYVRLNEFLRRHTMAVGFAMGCATAGALTGLYALHMTVRRLENILDPSIGNVQKQAEYIYVENLGFDDSPDKPPWEERKWETWTSVSYLGHWVEKRTKGLSWRLLEIISTTRDEQEKLRTLKLLKSQKNLGDADFQHLAQMCNSRTAAYLAREPNIDPRFFLTPPKRKECYDKNFLLDRFHDLLVDLKDKKNHWCLRYFVSKMFRHSNWFRELEYFVFEFVTSPLEIDHENAVKLCVESLLHHVMIQDNIHDMVESRGLEVLLDACRHVPDSFDLKLMAVKILMRVSSELQYLRDIHVTGWLRVLVEWSYECDQRLAAPAASALANLDRNAGEEGCCYKSEVCLLHPLHREEREPDVDVIIVHGLLGSVHSTWKQRNCDIPSNLGLSGIVAEELEDPTPESYCALSSPQHFGHYDKSEGYELSDFEFVLADVPESESEPVPTDVFSIPSSDVRTTPTYCGCCLRSQCWPKDWIPKDHRGVKILGVDYLSRITDWTNWCPFRHSEESAKLSERSKSILLQLLDGGVGERPVVWIGHSMGGLIIKHMLTQAAEQDSIKCKKLLKNTKYVFFLGTPHLGSPVASIRKYLAPLLPSVETRELELNSPELVQLHWKYCNVVEQSNIGVVTFLETKGTRLSVPPLELELNCVAPIPSDVGTGVIYDIPVGHIEIAKLGTRLSFIYIKILEAVRKAAEPDFDRPEAPTEIVDVESNDEKKIDDDELNDISPSVDVTNSRATDLSSEQVDLNKKEEEVKNDTNYLKGEESLSDSGNETNHNNESECERSRRLKDPDGSGKNDERDSNTDPPDEMKF